MNKLAQMIGTATRLATQNPSPDDVLVWQARDLEARISDWHQALAAPKGDLLLVDVVAGFFPIWQGEKVVALTADPVPQGWRGSARHPADLGLDEAAVLAFARRAGSLRDLRAALALGGDRPWCADATIDRVIAPFLMNRHPAAEVSGCLGQFARVLRLGGRLDLLVLAADEALDSRPVQVAGQQMQHFPTEADLAKALTRAGFHGVRLDPLLERPVLTVAGVELRAFAVSAHTGTAGACLDQSDAAIYLGPWSSVSDDDGHSYPRGQRMAVCAKTAAVLRRAPYAGSFLIVPAVHAPPLEAAPVFDCSRDVIRSPAETKGRQIAARRDDATRDDPGSADACCDGACGC
jgi:hypothetical protein